jgi:hypothetical protein
MLDCFPMTSCETDAPQSLNTCIRELFRQQRGNSVLPFTVEVTCVARYLALSRPEFTLSAHDNYTEFHKFPMTSS